MKIAIFGSSIYQSPETEGKIYAPLKIQFDLATELSRRGHDVHFFGHADTSLAPFKVHTLEMPETWRETLSVKKPYQGGIETLFRAAVYAEIRAQNFEILQDHNLYWSLPHSLSSQVPTVVTIHDSTSLPEYAKTYQEYVRLGGNRCRIAAVSDSMAGKLDGVSDVAIARNGIDVDALPFQEKPGDYLVWIGRVAPSKGLHHAIAVAREVGIPLKFAGPTGPFKTLEAEGYYEQQIKPYIDGKNIEYLGILAQQDAYKLLAEAYAYVFPSDGTEGMPMTVIESMATGTPVIATRKGPLPEMVRDGVNGFLYEEFDQLSAGIARVPSIDRAACREFAKTHFSLQAMTDSYEEIYKKFLGELPE